MDMKTKEGMKEYVRKVADTNKWIIIKDELMFTDLLEGLVENKVSCGYQSCPCRLASGKRELDRDLICPCDYAALDIKEYGACYCNLYLNQNFYEKGIDYIVVPERRPAEKDRAVIDYFNEV